MSLLHPVQSLFNMCLSTNSLPAEWKVHKIKPIPKKGNPLIISNYRPISLLCILSKVLESLIYHKIIDFIRPKLSELQFGFVKNKSCLTQLLTAFAIINEATDNKDQVDMVYLDFKKAFDTVSHNELLFKLWRIGITGNLWSWFRDYLKGRSHYVAFDNVQSVALPVISGVPQGSILGPLLFIIYVNDIPGCINHSHCFLFADDAKLLKIVKSQSDREDLQDDLSALSSWCKQWNLELNSSKCSALHFSPRSTRLHPNPVPYVIGTNSIPFHETQVDLGVIVTSKLSWSSQCEKVCAKCYRSLHMIRRNVPLNSSVNVKKQLYLTLVKSLISYCCQLYRPFLVRDIQSIERIQRRATKYILSDFTIDYKTRLSSLSMLPLMYWLDLQDLVFMVKCLKDPRDTINIFRHISYVNSSTRGSSAGKLTHRYTRLSSTRHFYFHRVVKLWNSIPHELLDLQLTTSTIKSRLRLYFWDHFKQNFNPDNLCTFHFVCPCHMCIHKSIH